MDKNESFESIRRGLLEFLVLKIISRGEVYSADILGALAETVLETKEGTLYPLLSKIHREGALEYRWQESEVGAPRKYYSLTGKGRARLGDLQEYWNSINEIIKRLGK